MRYEVYDEEGQLFRRFHNKYEAENFLQDGWSIVVLPKQKITKPNVETCGEARW